MSRNRPRGPPVLRDNGLAANEETDMWNKIVQDLRRAKEKNDQQKGLCEQIDSLNEKIGQEGNSKFFFFFRSLFSYAYAIITEPSLSEHNHLDNLLRQVAKLSEEERTILQDEPSDVIKNLGLLIALRQASEAEAPQNRTTSSQKSRKKRNEAESGSATDVSGPPGAPPSSAAEKTGRAKVQRSASVFSQGREGRDSRDSVPIKSEEGAESSKSTVAERNGQLVIGAEVVFKHNKNKQGIEGEGIQCIIKEITGEGYKRR